MQTNGNGKNGKSKHSIAEITAFLKKLEAKLALEAKVLAQLRESQAELQQARKRAAEQAAQLMEQGKPMPAPAALPEERKVEQAKDLLIEVRRAIASFDPDLLSWHAQLQAQQEIQNQKTVTEFMERIFTPAVQAFQDTLRKAIALREALGTLGTQDLEQCFTLPPFNDWRLDREAMKLFNQHRDTTSALQKLSHFRTAAEQRVLSDQRNKHFQFLDPALDIDGRFRVTREFKAAARTYKVGEVIDRFDTPEHILRGGLVGQPFGMAKLRRMSSEEEYTYHQRQQQKQQQSNPPQQKEGKEGKETR